MRPAVANVALREARGSLRLLALCMMGLVAVAYVVTLEYPTFRDRILAAGRHVPPFLRKMVLERAGGLRFESFVALAYLHPVTLALVTTWPIARASRAVAGEIERGALGWHLAYPIGRGAFLWGRALVLLAGVAALQLAFFVGFRVALAHLGLPNAGPMPYLWLAGMGTLLYGAIATLVLAVSAGASRTAVPGTAGAAIVLVGFLLENLGEMVPALQPYRWLSPFHYYDHQALLAGKLPATHDVAVLVGLLVFGLAAATWRFGRRDLSV